MIPFTIFSTCKAFRPPYAHTQYNAIKSWTLLTDNVVLLGNDAGVSGMAAHLHCRHVPDVDCLERFPLLPSLFEQAEAATDRELLCYVNADIILMSGFPRALQAAAQQFEHFLMIGHRWNVTVSAELDFSDGWEKRLRQQVSDRGWRGSSGAEDYFAFRKPFFQILPFAVAQSSFDNWIVWNALRIGLPVIDATEATMAVHQNHGQHRTSLRQRNKDLFFGNGEESDIPKSASCIPDATWHFVDGEISQRGFLGHD